jgi:hypothetical protein
MLTFDQKKFESMIKRCKTYRLLCTSRKEKEMGTGGLVSDITVSFKVVGSMDT